MLVRYICSDHLPRPPPSGRRCGSISIPLRGREPPGGGQADRFRGEGVSGRVREISQHVNANYDVEGLCRKLPERLQLLVDARGDRMKP